MCIYQICTFSYFLLCLNYYSFTTNMDNVKSLYFITILLKFLLLEYKSVIVIKDASIKSVYTTF